MAITLPAGGASVPGGGGGRDSSGDGQDSSDTQPKRNPQFAHSESASSKVDGGKDTGVFAKTKRLLRRHGSSTRKEALTREALREEFEHFRSSFFEEVMAELQLRGTPGIVHDLWAEAGGGPGGTRVSAEEEALTSELQPFKDHHYQTYRTGKQIEGLHKRGAAENWAPQLAGELDDDNDNDLATHSTSTDPSSFIWKVSHPTPQRATVVDAQGLEQGWPGHEWIASLVQKPVFDYGVGLLIMLNAISIGVQVDLHARNLTDTSPQIFIISEWVFCALFVLELGIRLYAFRSNFFCGAAWKWNVFDTLVVLLQLAEQSLTVILAGDKGLENLDLSAMRLMRILRLVRIVRLVRVMRLIGELRTIVISISGSMRSLGWTVILLLMLIYIIAVYLTQAVTDARIASKEGLGDHREALEHYYGSLAHSILALFQSITGGVTWEFALTPLIECISPVLGVFFAFYISFALLAIMNVVTGVFVESALQTAKADNDTILVGHVREIFSVRGNDVMDWEDFESIIQTDQMQQVCKTIDIDAREARALFQLLDIDCSGSVSFDEFLNGCLRLRGGAKAIDLMTVLYEGRRQQRYMCLQIKKLRKTLAAFGSMVVDSRSLPHRNETELV